MRVAALHTDADGRLWHATDDLHPCEAPEGTSLVTYAAHDEVRVFGVRRNVGLVLGAYGVAPRVVVVSPLAAPRGEDPAAALSALLHPPHGLVGHGGWRAIGPADAAAYRVAASADDEDCPVEGHPAWPMLSFLAGGGLPRAAAARFLAHVLDPRWFTHPVRPQRNTRLYAHLGVSPGNALAALRRGAPEWNFTHFEDALSCWWSPGAGPPPTTPDWAVLGRVYAQAGNVPLGLLAATKMLIDLACGAWAGGTFDAAVRLRPDELAAYREHEARSRRAV